MSSGKKILIPKVKCTSVIHIMQIHCQMMTGEYCSPAVLN